MEKRLQIGLFSLRIGVFLVMFMWTLDKFVNPEHAARVYQVFYMIPNLSTLAAYGIGILQMVIIIGFLLGLYKTWTYGAVLIMHAISTFSTYQIYLDPWGPRNLLFFAAFPMLAAIFTLFILREQDRLLTVTKA